MNLLTKQDKDALLLAWYLFFFRTLGGKPGSVTLKKDKQNLIGISIGGGAPLCPCLYIVQVFDNTPAAKEGTLQAGDEIVGVNGKSMRGKTKVDVARAIQAIKVSLFRPCITWSVHSYHHSLFVNPSIYPSDVELEKLNYRVPTLYAEILHGQGIMSAWIFGPSYFHMVEGNMVYQYEYDVIFM